MQAGQFSRTQGLRRKLSEPRSAGQSPAASLCSQQTTSDDDSNRVSFMLSVWPIAHVQVNKNMQTNRRTSPLFSVLFCVSRQKLASACPGKVDTGFPTGDMRKSRNLERIPTQSDRDAL